MDIAVPLPSADEMVERVAALVPWLREGAAELDEAAAFPAREIAALRDAGVLALPLPAEQHMADLESRKSLARQLAMVLIEVGRGNLALGRILEAHINARQLIARYGSQRQRNIAAQDVANGALFALWVTNPPQGGLRMVQVPGGVRLSGGKMFCSAAGYATRAVVTADAAGGEQQLLIVPLGAGETVKTLAAPLQGMRAAVTAAVDFTDVIAKGDARLGQAGDYLREPEFSAGAWRGSAVALGGLCALVELTTQQLSAAGRLSDPHQLQRVGNLMIARETSLLWVHRVAYVAEASDAEAAEIAAYTGLARITVESACLDAMRDVQRSLGLSAFRHGNPVERICRDLATYLRQPAPDEVLTEAAAYFADRLVSSGA